MHSGTICQSEEGVLGGKEERREGRTEGGRKEGRTEMDGGVFVVVISKGERQRPLIQRLIISEASHATLSSMEGDASRHLNL